MNGEHVLESRLLDGLYPKVTFLDNTKAAVYGENGFSLFSVSDSVSEVQTVSFEDEIKSVFSADRKMGFIFKNQDENGKYRMEIYNTAGKKTTTVYFDLDYRYVSADSDEVILYNEQEAVIYQYTGRIRFQCTLDNDITGMMASWEDRMYWLIEDQTLEEIRIE
jgi:hypothetical protein